MNVLENSLIETLGDSFHLLLDRPGLFVPKIISTTLSSIWILGLITDQASQFFFLYTAPLVILLGVFVSVMVAAMVKEQDRENILSYGFREALKQAKTIVLAAFALLVISFLLAVPASFGLVNYIAYGRLDLLLLGMSISLILIFMFTFVSYFLPVSLLEKKSVLKGFVESKNVSISNTREVTLLTLLSFGILGLAFLSQGYLETLGYVGFIGGRLVSTIGSTYLFVVSPKYYLSSLSKS
jgi:hypothetical protein